MAHETRPLASLHLPNCYRRYPNVCAGLCAVTTASKQAMLPFSLLSCIFFRLADGSYGAPPIGPTVQQQSHARTVKVQTGVLAQAQTGPAAIREVEGNHETSEQEEQA